MKNPLYIVEALRAGDYEAHHYIVGVFSTMEAAARAKQAEEHWRGYKYACSIEPHYLGTIDEKKLDALYEAQ